MKKTCELCGFNDNGYTIEDESGQVIKVCKFCRDGHLERNGMAVDAEEGIVSDFDKTLKTIDDMKAEEVIVPPPSKKKKSAPKKTQPKIQKEEIKQNSKQEENAMEDMIKEIEDILMKEDESYEGMADEVCETPITTIMPPPLASDRALEKKIAREEKFITRQQDMLKAIHPKIDDERIRITSPEVELAPDKRPKTNFDVAAAEFHGSVRFMDAFKLIYNKFLFLIIALLTVTAVAVVQAVLLRSWLEPLVTAAGGTVATMLGFGLMWFLFLRMQAARRSLLMRIRQQEILFESVGSDCYRELKTKYTVVKGIATVLFWLAFILPALVAAGTLIAGVIMTFLLQFWILAVAVAVGPLLAAAIFFVIMLKVDLINMSLDKEKNQQLQQQTMLDILKEIRKEK